MRLFFGLPLPDEIRLAAAARAEAAAADIPGRYAPAENYHITLAFLGDVPQARLADAQAVLRNCIARTPAPVLTLGETSYFGRPQNAILILRVLSDPPLDPLHAALVRALRAADLPADPGPFSPHITLARHAALSGAPLPRGDALRFIPEDACVFLSARNAQNVLAYTPIARAGFAGPDAISGI